MSTSRSRRSLRSRRWWSGSTAVALTALLILIGAGVAAAYFTASSAADGSGTATAATLPQANTPSVSASGSTVTVGWTQSTVGGALLGSYSGGGYLVRRYSTAGGGAVVPGSSCGETVSGAGTTLSCTEDAVPAGSWYYEVTPVLNDWTGEASDESTVVTTGTATDVVTSSANPGAVGTAVTYTATVTGGSGTPTGSVTFKDGSSPISSCGTSGVVALNSSGIATCTVTYASAGSHTITAPYGGSASYGAAAGNALSETIAGTSTTALASNYDPVATGVPVTYTATVTGSGSVPTGTVTFKDGNAPISSCGTAGVVTLGSGGIATCTVTYTSAGSHSITASYGGDATHASSTSSTLTQTVSTDGNVLTESAPTVQGGSSVRVTFNGSASANDAVTVYYCLGSLSACTSANASGSLTVTPSGGAHGSRYSWSAGPVTLSRNTAYTTQAYQTDPLGSLLASTVQQFTA